MIRYFIIATTWIGNIVDLIREHWFYSNTGQMLFWNMLAILSLITLLSEKQKEARKLKC